MRKHFLFLLSFVLLGAILMACGSSGEEAGNSSDSTDGDATSEETYTIGATQIVEHPSLDAAYEGFQAAIDEAGLNVEYDFQNAQNDQNNASTIANNFVADGVDLIFANSTPSAQSALQATSDIPILFTSVTDPVKTELVESMENPGGNVTGVRDLHPDAIRQTVDFIDENFEGSTIGLIYSAGEANSVTQIDIVNEAVEGTSLSTAERTVSNSAEVNQAASSLVGEADVFYIITDNTVVSGLEAVIGTAEEQGMPLFVGEPDSVERGGFLAYGFEYYDIGYRTGEMAVEILTGDSNPADIAVEYPPEINLYINQDAAEAQGIEWDESWEEEAEIVETTGE
ncbi:ABC transporter periplasmic protein [Gracilibacillus halophilus YIM-C55.5]|uniref:ABC transporter periplasmic protein n=1 Tax=Gracilibacillus halophilus YIM-C55.5 TaxID=1308866 RepID=N4W854_9BACI|nr:ABC transporter substrate-binding protein [Gracilibacillus halophilus]ENH96453.1 ABC transporter periplasmic protein [Gracilibacillus halophilus YIM-C55.5]